MAVNKLYLTLILALTLIIILPLAISQVPPPPDGDGDGYTISGGDCDDTNVLISPGATEICGDSKDNDCDGSVDNKDEDGDGYVDTACTGGTDCDDTDDTIFPGAPELCDGIKNDCDATSIPEDETDPDGDGYVECTPWIGVTTLDGGDCNNTDNEMFPGNVEDCDGKDNDCNGTINDGFDPDGDGYYNISETKCRQNNPNFLKVLDCDEENSNIYPNITCTPTTLNEPKQGLCSKGIIECQAVVDGYEAVCVQNTPIDSDFESLCDGVDDDCDGDIDEPNDFILAGTRPKCELEHGVCTNSYKFCLGAAGWKNCTSSDYSLWADLNFNATYEGTETLCTDTFDNDCDERADQQDGNCQCQVIGSEQSCFPGPVGSADVGICKSGTQSCSLVGGLQVWGSCTGYVLPVENETCDGLDEDCDGLIDEPFDLDNDGYADEEIRECDRNLEGDQVDCNDADSTINPGAVELCNQIDDDCDGIIDNVGGFSTAAKSGCRCVGGDDPLDEEEANGIDDDCDGIIPEDEIDQDDDGFSTLEGDCDDSDATIYPNAPESCLHNEDRDCNGIRGKFEEACIELSDDVIDQTLGNTQPIESLASSNPTPDYPTQTPPTSEQKANTPIIITSIIIFFIAGLIAYLFYFKPKSDLDDLTELHHVDTPSEKPTDPLQDYISNALSQGFNPHQIKGALIESGWDEDTVNEALGMQSEDIADLTTSLAKSKLDPSDDVKEVKDYIRKEIKHGYKPTQIRTTLREAGWSPDLIDAAMHAAVKRKLSNMAEKHGVHKPHDNLNKLQDFVEEAVDHGHTHEQISKTLEDAGWPDRAIDHALKK